MQGDEIIKKWQKGLVLLTVFLATFLTACNEKGINKDNKDNDTSIVE